MAHASVLLADDDDRDRQSLAAILTQEGYDVTAVTSYEAAETSLRAGGFDVAVVDVYLRGPDQGQIGLQLVRAYGRSVPIILLTAHANLADAREALRQAGSPRAMDYIIKGADPQQLLDAIKGVLLRRIFIVHGHDERSLNELVDFLKVMDLWPVVLHDLADRSQSIIEKFEAYSNVNFAVVLLTPDDVGRRADAAAKDLNPRPRQNVVFELGFFIGKLGRKRVAALRDDDGSMEIPSDYSGVQFIAKQPDGLWRAHLTREIRAAHIPIPIP